MKPEQLRAKVAKHYEDLWRESRIMEMRELAPGVVAVLDSKGDVDALFDTSLWEFADPTMHTRQPRRSQHSAAARGRLAEEGIGILCGDMLTVRSIDRLRLIAPFYLRRKKGATAIWHEK